MDPPDPTQRAPAAKHQIRSRLAKNAVKTIGDIPDGAAAIRHPYARCFCFPTNPKCAFTDTIKAKDVRR